MNKDNIIQVANNRMIYKVISYMNVSAIQIPKELSSWMPYKKYKINKKPRGLVLCVTRWKTMTT